MTTDPTTAAASSPPSGASAVPDPRHAPSGTRFADMLAGASRGDPTDDRSGKRADDARRGEGDSARRGGERTESARRDGEQSEAARRGAAAESSRSAGPGRPTSGDGSASARGASARRPPDGGPAVGPGPRRGARPSPAESARADRAAAGERGPTRRAGLDRTLDRDLLAPFVPPPAVLVPIAGPAGRAEPAASGSAAAHAEAAALAERLVTSLRVGRVGRDGHEIHLRLALARGATIEVRLRHEDGRLTARLDGEGAERLTRALEDELRARGLDCDLL